MIVDLNYKIIGDGQTVVLLHGLFGSLDNLQTLANQLSHKYQVVMIDLRNHGKSTHASEMTYPLMAGDVHALCQKLQVHNVYLVGHSMGGKVVCQMVHSFPGLVAKAVIIDIAPRKYPDGHHTIFEAMFSLNLQQIKSRNEAELQLQKFIPEICVRQFILKNLDRQTDQSLQWKLNLASIYKNYNAISSAITFTHKIKTPCLFVQGEHSSYINQNDKKDIEEKFENVEFCIIPNAGHWVHAENPMELLKQLNKFFES